MFYLKFPFDIYMPKIPTSYHQIQKGFEDSIVQFSEKKLRCLSYISICPKVKGTWMSQMGSKL